MAKLITLTKGQKALVDKDTFTKYSGEKWHVRFQHGRYYARRNPNIYLHYLVMGRKPNNERIKFKNGNTLDCRRRNLSYETICKGNSKYRGVTVVYRAEIQHDNKRYFKMFKSAEEAAKWYNVKAKEFLGDKAKLNVIK